MEKKHEKNMLAMKKEITRIRKLYGPSKNIGFSYNDLCIHLILNLLKDYKVPKFKTFNGTGNPMAYLRGFCDQLVGFGKNEHY